MTNYLIYALRRVFQAVPLILGIIVFNFVILNIVPGDPAMMLAGESGADFEYVESIRREFGFDKPIPVRLGLYLAAVFRGDFGRSFIYRQPVIRVVAERIPRTFLLMGVSLSVAVLLGIPLGTFAALRPQSKFDYALTGISLFGYCIPIFWLAQLLCLTFAVYLRWLPVQGYQNLRLNLTGARYVLDVLRHLALPVATLALVNMAFFTRISRSSVLDTINQDYVQTARAKGLPEYVVVGKHVFRNALIPIMTMMGLRFAYILAGSVITETVFAWPGIGRLLYDSIFTRDYPVLIGIFFVTSLMVVVANLVTDLLYGIVDPRIRVG